MSIDEKLSTCIKIAQSYILLFLKEYISPEQIKKIESLFLNCPIVVDNNTKEINEFGKITIIGGKSEINKISISLSDIEKVNIDNEFELNRLLGTIIHEYAHKIRAINNEYGEMFEEAFASIFAEVCINNARFKLGNNQEEKEIFEMLNSVNYQNYESQVRGILYILKQRKLDKKLIAEYIAGNQEIFLQICTQLFGNNFIEYFNTISSKNNDKSEVLLINIIIQYIKKNGLNISDYWSKDGNQLSQKNVYFRESPTLCKSIVSVGKEKFRTEEQVFYKYCESSVKVYNENNNLINQEKIDRIRHIIETKFSLKEKSLEEITDTIIDLCSAYIQHKSRDDEESKIFIKEITQLIPNIDSFKTKFVSLRIAGKEKNIFANIDLKNVEYSDINSSMDKLLNIEKEKSRFSR